MNNNEIQFLIKFGERQHMERFADGYLYFSNALRFRELENTLKKKGQGDYLEASSKIYGTDMKMYDYDTGEFCGQIQNSVGVFHYAPADNIPVFCLFTCTVNDCMYVKENNTYKLNLPNSIKQDIKEHFDKADTAAIITNPQLFIEKINEAFCGKAKMGQVNYFDIEGRESVNGQNVMDLEYFKYLTQDTPPEIVDGYKKYTFKAEYVYRSLLCKDNYFINEQEYRIMLPEQEISVPKEYSIGTSLPIKLFDIDYILNGNEFSTL